MNKFSSLLICLLITLTFYSQDRPPRNGMRKGERPAIGKLSGILIDQESNKPIEFATVTLKSKRDSSLGGGAISNGKGEFVIEKIKIGRYFAQVSFIGFKDQIVDSLFFNPRNPEKFIGKIYMSAAAENLDGVTIKAEKPLMMTKLDKKVFDVTQLTTATGGTANDILENLPSVQVDIDGNISLRGSSNVTILIDGRPSGLVGDQETILEQIPAETIETIELITNPSAKYNPENLSGIINVVLKKEKRKGFNGTLNAGLNTNPGSNATLGLNYRTNSANFHGSYSYRGGDRLFDGTSYRETQIGDTLFILDQVQDGKRTNEGHTVKGGIDFFLNDKNTIFISGLVNSGNGDDQDLVLSNNFIDSFNNFDFSTSRDAIEIEDQFSYDVSLGYKKTFLDPDKEWTTDIKYTERNDDEVQDFLQNNYNEDGFLIPGTNLLQKVENNRFRKQINIQSDYIHPINEDKKLEFGTQIILTENDGDFRFSEFDDTQDSFVEDVNVSNRFILNQDIYSAYALYGQKVSSFQYQLGLRAETAEVKGDQVSTGETFSFDYFSFFPSVHLSQKLSEKQEVQLSYSRRIQRPRSRALNPFEDLTDPNNIRVGNPELRPEYISSFELNHIIIWNKLNLSSGLYFRDIQNVMRRFRIVDDSTGVATSTFVNLDSGQNYGFEFVLSGRPTKNMRINASVDLFRSVLNGSNQEAELNNAGFSWSNRVMASYNISKSFEAQISSRYLAPNVTAQGEWSGFLSTDVSVKKSFVDNKLSLTLRLSDIFNTREFSFNSSGSNFFNEGFRKRKSRILNFSAFYRFGKLDDKNRRGNRNRNNSQGGGGDFEPDI